MAESVLIKHQLLMNRSRRRAPNHPALVQRKYRLLFSPTRRAKPGPKGPDQDLIRVVVDMKQRNPRWGCPRIAKQIALAFGRSIIGACY
jgi:hypothetical protein